MRKHFEGNGIGAQRQPEAQPPISISLLNPPPAPHPPLTRRLYLPDHFPLYRGPPSHRHSRTFAAHSHCFFRNQRRRYRKPDSSSEQQRALHSLNEESSRCDAWQQQQKRKTKGENGGQQKVPMPRGDCGIQKGSQTIKSRKKGGGGKSRKSRVENRKQIEQKPQREGWRRGKNTRRSAFCVSLSLSFSLFRNWDGPPNPTETPVKYLKT